MNISASSVVVVTGYADAVKHFEIVKLMRLVDEDDGGETAAEAAISVTVEAIEAVNVKADVEATLETAELAPVLASAPPDDDGYEPPAPISPTLPRTVTGVIVTEGAPEVEPRPSLAGVSFSEALRSGKYNANELIQIGNREAMNTAFNLRWQQQRWGNRSWGGLVNRLPVVVG